MFNVPKTIKWLNTGAVEANIISTVRIQAYSTDFSWKVKINFLFIFIKKKNS